MTQAPEKCKPKINAWKVVPYCVVIPCVLIYFVFFYIAAVQGAAYSFTDWNGISAEKTFVGVQNYVDAFNSDYLRMTLRFTVIFAVMVLVLTNILGLFLAVLLDKKIRGVNFFRAVYFFPAVMSTLTIAYIFNQIDYRLVTLLGEAIGNPTLAAGLFSSPTWAPYLVGLTQVWQSFPITMVIYLAGLQGVPEDILESARIDGANSQQMFWRIKIPMIIPAIMINLVNNTKTGITAFDIVMGTTAGGPGGATYSFAMYMYIKYSKQEVGYACAIAMIMAVIFGVIATIQIIYMRSKEVEL
ncbi:MAG: carbohydrate ABC transporter permease [Acutalibacteraceae bacterium]